MSAVVRRALPLLKVLADAKPKLKKSYYTTRTHRIGDGYFRDCSEPELKDIGNQNFYSLYLLYLPVEYLISRFRVSSTFGR